MVIGCVRSKPGIEKFKGGWKEIIVIVITARGVHCERSQEKLFSYSLKGAQSVYLIRTSAEERMNSSDSNN